MLDKTLLEVRQLLAVTLPIDFRHGSEITAKELDMEREYSAEVEQTAYTLQVVGLGTASMCCSTYVIYHLISKYRGNEKNRELNNWGMMLAFLLLIDYGVWFTDSLTYLQIRGKN